MKFKLRLFKLEKFKRNLKLLFCVVLFSGVKTLAQSPDLTVKGEEAEKVRMNKLFVNVKVVGNIAYTTAEMHFFNSSSRQMEAELIFPLPENVSVSRYAIDINGKIREAVPVNKNKGKQVFEAVEHRRVDPGLLEKVDGNNFRTRIYPLMPNGERTVIIGYEEELSAFDKDNLVYQLISRFPKKLDQFEINVSVLGSSNAPVVAENSGDEITFSKWNQSFQASVKKENYQPSEKIVFKIPIKQDLPSVIMQDVGGQYYFYGNSFVEGNKAVKKTPNSIGLIWDNSLSCQNRDLKKELDLLDAYFQKLKNTKVSLYFLNYTFEKKQDYIISNGNWSELRTMLQNAKYDGGTRFSQIVFSDHDEYLFFTDGLSSLSENLLPKTKKPINIISSSVSSDFSFLNYSAMKTGGSFVNLNQLNTEVALDKLTNTNLKFLGIKENVTVTDLYPMEGTSVSGNFSFSAISLKPKNEITLLFGYNDEAVFERKVILDVIVKNTNDVNIEKLWAQKKIANLDYEYAKNADEIELLGKKYGIITKNTSLIVLEDIRDYILYDIIPPAELREEFYRIKKQEHDNTLAQQKNNWESIDSYFEELNTWWKKDLKYTAPKVLPKNKKKKLFASNSVGSTIRSQRSTNIPAGFVSGIVLDENNIPLPGANVRVNNEGVTSDFDGKFSIKAPENSVITFDFIGYNSYRLNVGRNNQVTMQLSPSSSSLQEVVVVGNGTIKGDANAKLAVEEDAIVVVEDIKDKKVGSEEIPSPPAPQVDQVKFVRPVVAKAEEVTEESPKINSESDKLQEVVVVASATVKKSKEWNPDRLYLKALISSPKEKQYELYLELRKAQERNPSFYFDVAHFFYNEGDIKKALQVISNIADLGLENHQLYKTLAYTLRQWNDFQDAVFVAKQVAKWRAHEPQSSRDYALALEDAGKPQEAFNELVKALEVNYYGEMRGQYEGVEDIILMDINRLTAKNKNLNTSKLDKKYLEKMPVDIRVIMNWNQMDVDLDLHIIEPTGEECYFSHTSTEAGAKFSKDFTQGYGPEQYLIRNAVKGKYQIKTNYYGESELNENGPATVMVEIYTTKLGNTTRMLKTIQLGKVKENEILAEIVW